MGLLLYYYGTLDSVVWDMSLKNTDVMGLGEGISLLIKCLIMIERLYKLYKYGIRDIEHKWFKPYLSDIRQIVRVDEKVATELPIKGGSTIGVQLGSNILFLICVNDPLITEITHLMCDVHINKLISKLSQKNWPSI